MMESSDHRRDIYCWLLNFVVGFAIGYMLTVVLAETISATQTTSWLRFVWYFSAFSASAIFGVLNPRRVWRWGVAGSIGFILAIVSPDLTSYPISSGARFSTAKIIVYSLGAIIGSFAGAVSGLLIRRSADTIRKDGWRSLWP